MLAGAQRDKAVVREELGFSRRGFGLDIPNSIHWFW
jgi:hypothetical protein